MTVRTILVATAGLLASGALGPAAAVELTVYTAIEADQLKAY
jgi:hypothetical protein